MSFLLDTNVISEWVRPRPEPKVVRWLAEADEDRLFLSVLTFTEIRQGIEEMATGARRDALNRWLENDLRERFHARILQVDLTIAESCGTMLAQRKRAGIGMGVIDALFAATAAAKDLILVTRNTKHFAGLNIELLNPWIS